MNFKLLKNQVNLLFACGASLLPLGGVAQQKLPIETDLNIMTYNICHGQGMDNKIDYARVVKVITSQNADVVALQEVDSVTKRTGGVDVLRLLGSETLMHPTFARAIPFDGGAYGVGILSKEKPISVRRVPLPGREEARVLLVAEFKEFYMGCTHLSLTPEDQQASLPIIRSVASSLDKPFVLAGDWNADSKSTFIYDVRKDFTILNDVKRLTWPSDKPTELLDYIAVWKPTGHRVLRKGINVLLERVASDHRPVCASLKFYQPLSDILYANPYLQNPTADGITVMFQTRVMANCWVEYGTDTLHLQRARTLQAGQAVCYDVENKIRLSGLKPGTPYYYRVCASEIGYYYAYSKAFGDTLRTSFRQFTLPASDAKDFTAVILNDMHSMDRTEQVMAEAVKKFKYDFVIFNGDCLPEPSNREEAIYHINRLATRFGGDTHPLFFIRGNHEIRNAYSAGMVSLFDNPGGHTYGAFSWGDTRFVLLDCGEDKLDTHWVYYGLNDFSGFRADQTVFLKEELRSKDFRRASRHVLCCHIPLWGNTDEYRPCTELWEPLLKKAPFDINLTAHTHQYNYIPKGKEGAPFPVYTGGGYELESATFAVLQKHGKELKLSVYRADGTLLKEVEF